MYIFWFLHQTTTYALVCQQMVCCISFDSYIKPQLRVLPTSRLVCCISFDSYIKPQLNDANMRDEASCISFDSYIKPQLICVILYANLCCISFDSYIKPQHIRSARLQDQVVYLLIPTSNHNAAKLEACHRTLYIFWFLHQTTTRLRPLPRRVWLYIFWFLHQTTTSMDMRTKCRRCISFDSYIKPQLMRHIPWCRRSCISFDSYIKPQLTWNTSCCT